MSILGLTTHGRSWKSTNASNWNCLLYKVGRAPKRVLNARGHQITRIGDGASTRVGNFVVLLPVWNFPVQFDVLAKTAIFHYRYIWLLPHRENRELLFGRIRFWPNTAFLCSTCRRNVGVLTFPYHATEERLRVESWRMVKNSAELVQPNSFLNMWIIRWILVDIVRLLARLVIRSLVIRSDGIENLFAWRGTVLLG